MYSLIPLVIYAPKSRYKSTVYVLIFRCYAVAMCMHNALSRTVFHILH